LIKRKARTRLGYILVVCTVLSFLVSALAFLGMNRFTDRLIDKVIYPKEKIIAREKQLFSDFIGYMNENRAGITDSNAIRSWLKTQKHVMLAVYDARSSYLNQEEKGMLYSLESDPLAVYNLLKDEYVDYWYSGAVMSSGDMMRSRSVKVMYYPMYMAADIAVLIDLIFAFVMFVLIVFACIRRKTRYIALLSRELQVMQGGDLSVPMTVRGNDELTTLATDIEEMRKSFIERLETEERMKKSSSELLTAMSHDLRTPLTSLIGYLDIVDLGKCATPEQEKKYIHSGKLKAYQIKEMTDKLFEYFLVYESSDEKLETETLDAGIVFSQLWAESSLILETEGFTISVSESGEGAVVEANVSFLRRVFDNIVSNIRKYADKDEPVICNMGVRDMFFTVEVINSVGVAAPKAESSGIGLASCRKIAQSHGGSFVSEERDGRFVMRLSIPAASAEAETDLC